MNHESITILAKKFRSLVKDLDIESYYKSFHTAPQHDGSPHIESHSDGFHFVVTECGAEIERIKGLTSDDVLYLLFESVTLRMATTYEPNNRKEGIDGRSIWFPYQENLMRNIKIEWGKRLKEEHQKIIEQHPFREIGGDAQHQPSADR